MTAKKKSESRLFVDSTDMHTRSKTLSASARKEEEEATYFAMCLLMPSTLLEEAHANALEYRPRLNDEELIDNLAKMFEVSPMNMTLRLQQLKLI